MRVTREDFEKLTNNFNNYQSYLSSQQNLVLSLYLNGDDYNIISKKLNMCKNRIGIIIRGDNKFGRNGIYRKLRNTKIRLNMN